MTSTVYATPRSAGTAAGPSGTVVIIGGRATGVAAAIHLVDVLPPGAEIVMIDPQDSNYPSVFFDSSPELLLNTSAHVGSLYSSKPDDFLEYVTARGINPHSVPRAAVGDYVSTRFPDCVSVAAERGILIDQIIDTVNQVSRDGWHYLVKTQGGRCIKADDVVIAVGAGPISIPDGLSGYPHIQHQACCELAQRRRPKSPPS